MLQLVATSCNYLLTSLIDITSYKTRDYLSTLCIQSLFYLIHICWQLLSFLVSAWHAYPNLRALSHEHCCKLSCAFFPFTGIWQWYFHIFWNIHPCCYTHTRMNIYISLSLSIYLSIYLISIYLSIPCTSCRCKWISR